MGVLKNIFTIGTTTMKSISNGSFLQQQAVDLELKDNALIDSAIDCMSKIMSLYEIIKAEYKKVPIDKKVINRTTNQFDEQYLLYTKKYEEIWHLIGKYSKLQCIYGPYANSNSIFWKYFQCPDIENRRGAKSYTWTTDAVILTNLNQLKDNLWKILQGEEIVESANLGKLESAKKLRKVDDESVSCPACGTKALPNSLFCSTCGKPIAVKPKSCFSCGAEVSIGSGFCTECGAKIL